MPYDILYIHIIYNIYIYSSTYVHKYIYIYTYIYIYVSILRCPWDDFRNGSFCLPSAARSSDELRLRCPDPELKLSLLASRVGFPRARKDHINIRILQKSISGISLILGFSIRMQDPCLYVVFLAPISVKLASWNQSVGM